MILVYYIELQWKVGKERFFIMSFLLVISFTIYDYALGIAYTLRMGLEEIKNASSISSTNADNETFQILLVVGGGSKNKLWRQIISDVLNVTLKFPVEAESAALGAAFQAGAAFYNVPVDKYVMGQNVKVEDEVVVPSYEDKMDEAYSFGYESFQSWSRKLYD